jgi:hypothetical protein
MGSEDWKFVVNAENRVDTEARSSNASVISLSNSGAGGMCVIWKRGGGCSEPRTYNCESVLRVYQSKKEVGATIDTYLLYLLSPTNVHGPLLFRGGVW